MAERGVADLTVLVAVHFGVLAAECLEFVQHFASPPHLLYRIRAEEVEVDEIELMRIFAVITFRPFLCVTDRTHRSQVSARHEITLGVVLNEIRERQVGGVRMVGVTSHDEGESTHFGWPEKITVAGRLRATFGYTLVNRTQFVHVVRLIRTRAGIEEREHSCNEEGRFMVSHRVRTCEDRTSFSVHSLAVGEEKTLTCRVVFIEDTALSHEALVHQGGITYFYA